jgi:hypothetical protein
MQSQDNTLIIPYVEIKKGSAFSYLISSDQDLRGTAILGGIRRKVPGKDRLRGYVASAVENSAQVRINRFPATAGSTANILNDLGVREGDLITIPGANIEDARIQAISLNTVVIDQLSTRTINDTPFSFKSSVTASFNFLPLSQLYSVSTSMAAVTGDRAIAVEGKILQLEENTTYKINRDYSTTETDGMPVGLSKYDRLIFGKNGQPVTVEITESVGSGLTIIPIADLSEDLPEGANARLSTSTMVLRSPLEPSDTSAQVNELYAPIGKDAYLTFVFKGDNGWQVAATVIASESALEGATEVQIERISDDDAEVPAGSIAYYGTAPFRSFYVVLDTRDTDAIEAGTYAADIAAIRPENVVSGNIAGVLQFPENRIAQFSEVVFVDTWVENTEGS